MLLFFLGMLVGFFVGLFAAVQSAILVVRSGSEQQVTREALQRKAKIAKFLKKFRK